MWLLDVFEIFTFYTVFDKVFKFKINFILNLLYVLLYFTGDTYCGSEQSLTKVLSCVCCIDDKDIVVENILNHSCASFIQVKHIIAIVLSMKS